MASSPLPGSHSLRYKHNLANNMFKSYILQNKLLVEPGPGIRVT